VLQYGTYSTNISSYFTEKKLGELEAATGTPLLMQSMISTRLYSSKLLFASTVVRIISERVQQSGRISPNRIERVRHTSLSDFRYHSVATHPSSSTSTQQSSSRMAATVLTRNKRAPITVTERAAARIHELLSNRRDKQQEQQPVGIRLSVKRRGCNGYSYTLNYVHSESEFPKDEIVQASNNVTIFIDPMALFSIVGTRMDWVDTELSSEFTFENPNSKGECGCGESFTV
jgi:iron-sulfur cluster assembly accessory protein